MDYSWVPWVNPTTDIVVSGVEYAISPTIYPLESLNETLPVVWTPIGEDSTIAYGDSRQYLVEDVPDNHALLLRFESSAPAYPSLSPVSEILQIFPEPVPTTTPWGTLILILIVAAVSGMLLLRRKAAVA